MMCNIVCFQIVSRKKLHQQTFSFHSNLLSLPLCTEILDRVILSLLHHHAPSPHPQCQCHHLHHSSLTPSLASPLHTPKQSCVCLCKRFSHIYKTNVKENIIWRWRWNPCSLQITSGAQCVIR